MPDWPPKNTELIEFFEGYIEKALGKRDIPGALLAVVSPEKTGLFGFGISNIESSDSPDPRNTPHRIASLTKPITALGALMLVDEGLLDLESPITEQLPEVSLQSNPSDPVRLRHLLTHTAGLDERLVGVSYRSPAQQKTLRDHLEVNLPPTVLPPGKKVFYSNYGFALIGLLIQTVTGELFQDWISDQILAPLGLEDTFFETPQELRSSQTVGYENTADGYKLMISDDFSHILPAGGLVSTAADMSLLIQFFLHPENQSLIDPVLLNRMLSQQFMQVEDLGGPTFGMFESRYAGLRSISQTGGAPGFGSLLYIMPDDQWGFFLGTNRLEEGILAHLPAALLHRFAALRPVLHKNVKTISRRPGFFHKEIFRHNRYAHRGIEKLMAVCGQFAFYWSGEEQFEFGKSRSSMRHFIRGEGSDELYRMRNDYPRIRVADKKASLLFQESTGMTLTFERIHWIESIEAQALLAGLGLLLQLIVVLYPLHWIAQAPIPAWLTLKAGCAANLLFALTLAAQSRDLLNNYWQFAYGIPTMLRLSLSLPYASLFSLGLSLAFLFDRLNEPSMTFSAGLMYMFGVMGALCFFAVLRYWNILRFPPFLRR